MHSTETTQWRQESRRVAGLRNPISKQQIKRNFRVHFSCWYLDKALDSSVVSRQRRSSGREQLENNADKNIWTYFTKLSSLSSYLIYSIYLNRMKTVKFYLNRTTSLGFLHSNYLFHLHFGHFLAYVWPCFSNGDADSFFKFVHYIFTYFKKKHFPVRYVHWKHH